MSHITHQLIALQCEDTCSLMIQAVVGHVTIDPQ